MNIKNKIVLCTILMVMPVMNGPSSQEITLEKYLQSDSETSLNILGRASDQELQQWYEEFKKGKNIQELRMLKLAEEYLNREADRIAASRLTYLTIAILALLALLFGCIGYIMIALSKMKHEE